MIPNCHRAMSSTSTSPPGLPRTDKRDHQRRADRPSWKGPAAVTQAWWPTLGQDGEMANRLAEATSPYLLQHADNPVDWQEWGEEAFSEARRRDVPVLLSVGYAACHWCHVMAHESFEHGPTAAYLNLHFVSIKVDREERPA